MRVTKEILTAVRSASIDRFKQINMPCRIVGERDFLEYEDARALAWLQGVADLYARLGVQMPLEVKLETSDPDTTIDEVGWESHDNESA